MVNNLSLSRKYDKCMYVEVGSALRDVTRYFNVQKDLKVDYGFVYGGRVCAVCTKSYNYTPNLGSQNANFLL